MPCTKLLQNLNFTDALLQNLGFPSRFAEFIFRRRPSTEFVSQTPCRIHISQMAFYRIHILQTPCRFHSRPTAKFVFLRCIPLTTKSGELSVNTDLPLSQSAMLCDRCLFASTVSCLLRLCPCSSVGRIFFSRVNFLC